MGRKRKIKSEHEIRKKIRRLEAKLQRRYRESHRDSETQSFCSSAEQPEPDRYMSDGDDIAVTSPPTSPLQVHEQDMQQNPTPALLPETDPSPETSMTDPILLSTSSVPEEILKILGEAKKTELELGEKIPHEISERWGRILLDGLDKEQKTALIEKMLVPENFLLVQAPKLNPEVAAVLSDAAKNRDKRLEKSQSQLGSGIAGLVNLTKDLIKSDIDKIIIIKRLSELSQLLLDLHYEETLNRRKLIVPLLDKKFWNTIQSVKRETFLFGDNLGENIKNSKDIERSSQQIKKPFQNFQRKPPMPGNTRFPPRQQNTKMLPAAAGRHYEAQPPAAARRYNGTTQPRGRAAPAPRDRQADRRRK